MSDGVTSLAASSSRLVDASCPPQGCCGDGDPEDPAGPLPPDFPFPPPGDGGFSPAGDCPPGSFGCQVYGVAESQSGVSWSRCKAYSVDQLGRLVCARGSMRLANPGLACASTYFEAREKLIERRSFRLPGQPSDWLDIRPFEINADLAAETIRTVDVGGTTDVLISYKLSVSGTLTDGTTFDESTNTIGDLLPRNSFSFPTCCISLNLPRYSDHSPSSRPELGEGIYLLGNFARLLFSPCSNNPTDHLDGTCSLTMRSAYSYGYRSERNTLVYAGTSQHPDALGRDELVRTYSRSVRTLYPCGGGTLSLAMDAAGIGGI